MVIFARDNINGYPLNPCKDLSVLLDPFLNIPANRRNGVWVDTKSFAYFAMKRILARTAGKASPQERMVFLRTVMSKRSDICLKNSRLGLPDAFRQNYFS